MSEPKKQPMKVVFADSFFDSLAKQGLSQEEADALIATIREKAASGEMEAESVPLADSDLSDDELSELAEAMTRTDQTRQ